MAFEIKKNVLKQYIPEQCQTEAVVPKGIDTIGTKAFENCGELNSIILPDGITVLKQYALDSYEFKIKRLRVPATLQETGKNSFPGGLKVAELPGGTVQFALEHDSYEVTEVITYLLNIAEKSFSELRAGSRLELALVALAVPSLLKEGVHEEILQYAKAQKKKLLDIILTNGLTDALGGALTAGLVTTKTVDDCIAKAGGHVAISAMLLDCKNQQISPLAAKQEEIYKPELAFKPLSVADAKKNWGFDKNETGTGYILTSYKGTEATIEIPAIIGKLPVVEIRGICNCTYNSRFSYARQDWLRNNIVAVHIPEGIHTIGDCAFADLEHLKTACLPESIRRIGKSAFEGCQSLTEIHLPECVTVLEYQAFGSCTGMKKMTIPASVQEINPWAFNRSPTVTIHAPAGSYAEQYAKENNILFVVE